MLTAHQSRKRYPSDLTDEQWTLVEPLLPPTKPRQRGGRPRTVDMREVLNMLWSRKNGHSVKPLEPIFRMHWD